jgi:hypothetical protein
MGPLKNPKHEAFARAVAMGAKAATAYREHVATKPDITQGTADVQSCRLAQAPNVSLRIEELRKSNAEIAEKRFAMTREQWLERLATIAEKAEDAEDFSAATGALAQIGKATDYYAPKKVELSGSVGVELGEAVAKVFGAK